MSIEKYVNLLKNLLPRGLAWEKVKEHALIRGLAVEFSRVGERAGDLEKEFDPNQALETIEDWERVVGLPDECTPDTVLTIEERRQQVIQKLAIQGNLSAKFYEEIAAVYGYDATATNYLSFQVGRSKVGDKLSNYFNPRSIFRVGQSHVGEQLKTWGWLHYFNVELPESTRTTFRVGENKVGDRLALFGNPRLECTYKRLKPAHSGITFTFK